MRWATDVSWYLVEQHDPELVAQDAAHLRKPGELCGEGDLVAEVEQVPFPLGGSVTDHQVGQFTARGGGLGDLAQIGVAEPDGLQGVQEAGVPGAQCLRAYEVFGEFGVQGEEVADQVGEGAGERRIGGREPRAGPARRVGSGWRRRADGRSAPDRGAGRDRSGGGPRRRDTSRSPVRPVGLSGSITSGSVTPALINALRTRSASSPAALLVKVRPRTCSGGDLTGADQPHHARGHHRRLAGPGSGHDHLRGAGGATMQAVCSGVKGIPEELLELLGIGEMGGHVERS